MYRTTLTMLAAGAMAIVGCENKSPPGGPGTAASNSGRTAGTPDNTFRISAPGVTLKQGETKAITVSVTRGVNFDQDLKLEVMNGPQGVTFKFDDSTLRASAKEAHLTIEASNEAALGEHKVAIKATPAREGAATNTEIKIEIKKP
jgi:uncharacterized membrane protein